MEISEIGLLTAFLAGIISFLSPCVLPLVPGYVSFIAGRTQAGRGNGGATAIVDRLPVLGLSLCFVLGFSTVFILLGASATALGQLLLSYRYELNIVGGAIVTLFGLLMTGMVTIPFLQRDMRFESAVKGGEPAGAYVLGLAFGFGWAPCIGPVLGAILTISAANVTVGQGVTLLAVYAAGLGVPFLAAAAFTDEFMARVGKMRKAGRYLQIGAGVIVIIMGIAMMTGELTVFAFWFLDTFPILGRIG
jgi:cytochrome c-type biogenesis protein